jgi:parallel beta-helix repeat protein
MSKIYVTLLFLIATFLKVLGINYYVNPLGSNSNNGLTTSTAFKTLTYAGNQTAAGDTVFVMNGTYTNTLAASNVLSIYNSGTATNGIVYKNYVGHTPIIKLNANNWAGISVQGADYITIDGIKIIGNNSSVTLAYAQAEQNNLNNPATSANGIGIVKEYNNVSNKPHHVIIRNCNISQCGGAGVYSYNADYITIENNSISECAWYSPYGNSGISLYQCWNSDASTGIKNYVIGNTCYRNEEYIPFYPSPNITDGNGIIIDDGRNTQNNSPLGIYNGKTYVSNNLVFDNGGRGIHCYLSDKVIIVNNTCYHNCQSPSVSDGELTAYYTDSVSFINNISMPSTGIKPVDTYSSTNTKVKNNLWAANSGIANPLGINTVTTSPAFMNATSNTILANFHLQSSSGAINNGTHQNAPLKDKDSNNRPASDSVDIGCYEFPITTGISAFIENTTLFSIYPNPSSSLITITWSEKIELPAEIIIYNTIGEKIKIITVTNQTEFSELNIGDLKSGIYYLSITIDSKHEMNQKIIKTE